MEEKNGARKGEKMERNKNWRRRKGKKKEGNGGLAADHNCCFFKLRLLVSLKIRVGINNVILIIIIINHCITFLHVSPSPYFHNSLLFLSNGFSRNKQINFLITFTPTQISHFAMATPLLKAVALTHVRYQKGDQLGYFLAWVSLVPVFISLGGFVSHFFFRRELQGVFFYLGLVVSQLINEFIKTTVQQARPETCALLETCDSDGWPSSHSQYMFFFAVYFTLLTCKGIGLWGIKNRWFLNVLHWTLAVLTMYSRVYLGYHTVAQVFAGATLGILIGAGWFWFVDSVLFPYFPAIEESDFGRYFYLKDTSYIPDVLKFEYENARAARNNINKGSKSS